MTISYNDLENAFFWASSSIGFNTEAFISRATGEFYYRGDDSVDEPLPQDIEDENLYIALPNKHDLDLGHELIYKFARHNAAHLEQDIREIFRRKGAYSRFKDLLLANDLLDSWYKYESQATRTALEEWASANGFSVRDQD